MRTFGLALALVCLGGAGCLDNEQSQDAASDARTFIALDRDFYGFQEWQSFDLGDTVIDSLPIGRRHLYVSQMPPPGATEFPVGTKLVKVFEDERPASEWEIYAMVKRGGGFNGKGALGWEWFELQTDAAGVPVTEWRGTVPPSGRTYRCISVTDNSPDCNACHAASQANDYVNSKPLQLE